MIKLDVYEQASLAGECSAGPHWLIADRAAALISD
jgi:hypothetical protein